MKCDLSREGSCYRLLSSCCKLLYCGMITGKWVQHTHCNKFCQSLCFLIEINTPGLKKYDLIEIQMPLHQYRFFWDI
jgi:hypothetical protein